MALYPLPALIIKLPLKSIERITPNIYNVDIGGYSLFLSIIVLYFQQFDEFFMKY